MSVHCQYNVSTMLIQKVFKNGNSLAITIPKEFLKELDLRDGSKVVLEKKDNNLFITAHRRVLASDVDAKFMKMVDEFITEHEDVLAELSKR